MAALHSGCHGSVAERVKSKPDLLQSGGDMIRRLLLALCWAAVLTVSATACHTAHGAGEDIESAGQKIQNNTPP